MTQSIATPEPSSMTIPTLDRTLVARQSLECVTKTRLAVGEDCHPRTTWRPLTIAGSPVLPHLRLTGGVATPTRRYHGRRLTHPSLLRVPHTRKFGTLASPPPPPPPPVFGMPWGPHPLATKFIIGFDFAVNLSSPASSCVPSTSL